MTSAYERANAVRTDSGGRGGASRGSPHGEARECHLFWAGFFRKVRKKKKKNLFLFVMLTNDRRGWSNVFKIGFNWSRTWKRTAESKDWQPKKWRRRSRKSGPGLERRRGSTEQCCELDRVRARERIWNNTEQSREAERTTAIEKSWNTRKTYSEDYTTSRVEMCSRARSHMISSGDQQEKSNVFVVFRGKNTAGKE